MKAGLFLYEKKVIAVNTSDRLVHILPLITVDFLCGLFYVTL